MAQNDSNNTNSAEQPGLSQSQIRTLRLLVIITSVLLASGFIGLLTVIVYKLTTMDNKPAVSNSAKQSLQTQKNAVEILIEQDAKVKSFVSGQRQTTVHITGSKTDEIIVLNNSSGKVINRFLFKNK